VRVGGNLLRAHTIFSDQHPDAKPTGRKKVLQPDSKIQLSEDEFKEIVKKAYKDGVKDAKSKVKKDGHSLPVEAAPKIDDPHISNAVEEKTRSEGFIEAVKTEAKQQEQTRHKLENIANRHDIEVLRIKGVFPFDLFPDTLIIDTTKVTIVKSQMFATENIITIPLKDLADVHVQTALFLASLTIAYMPQASSPGMLKPEEEQIACLKRKDVLRAKNILKGIMVAQAEEIDIAKLSPEEVFALIEKVGHSEGIT
jgi:hypothetical protein